MIIPGPPAAFASSSFGMPSSLRRRCPLADDPPAARASCAHALTRAPRAQENIEKRGKVGQFQREKLPSILMKPPTESEFEKSHILQANKATADSYKQNIHNLCPTEAMPHVHPHSKHIFVLDERKSNTWFICVGAQKTRTSANWRRRAAAKHASTRPECSHTSR